MNNNSRSERIEGALWGMFVADALSMPIHWYYNRKNIYRDFPSGIQNFEAPPHPHPEAFMIGMTYRPDVEKARELERPIDILHEHARFYNTTYSDIGFALADREGSHGNAVAAKDERFHYHSGLNAGDNTLGAHLARVLMRQVIDDQRYDPNRFIQEMIEHMTTPGRNRDPYTEIYLRRWFENYTAGANPFDAAEHQRNVWSIGSHGGIIRPMVLSLLFPDDTTTAISVALTHQIITHRSETVAGGLSVAVPLLSDLINGEGMQESVKTHGAKLRMPAVTGSELFELYRSSNGPGNIPRDTMWHLHMDRSEVAFDPESLYRDPGDDNVVMGAFATACYPEHGIPLALYHAWRYADSPFDALVADANAGGDNVNRGMILGLLAGATEPEVMKEKARKLSDFNELQNEITRYCELAGNRNVY